MTKRTNRDNARDDLIAFAKWTLATLEREEEWSADTLDNIASHALAMNVAKLDRHGMFTRVQLPTDC